MPHDVETLIWVAGGGFVALLIMIVTFFLKRLVSTLDEIQEQLTLMASALKKIELDLGRDINDLEKRIVQLEAVCDRACVHHRRYNDQ
jgi:hypothetical protein